MSESGLVKTCVETLEAIKATNEKHGNVYFTRFGDGDLIMLSGSDLNDRVIDPERKFGGNRTRFFPYLQECLRKTFDIEAPNYLKAVSMHWKTEPGMMDLLDNFRYAKTLHNKVSQVTDQRDFYNPVTFQYLIACRQDLFDEFCDEYIKPKKTLFIGSANPKNIECIYGKIDHWIETIPQTAVDTIDETFKKVEQTIIKHKPEVVMPCCGQLGRAIHSKIWDMGYNGNVLDLGSVVDIFENRPSRSWIRKIGEKVRENYGHN